MGLKKRTKISSSFNMSSMTDIVFLLLIFFMITSTMVHPNAIKLLIPKQASKQVVISKFVEVRVSANGNFYIKNKRISKAGFENALIRNFQKNKNSFVKLYTDTNAPTGAVALVLDIAETNGVKVVLM